MTARLLCTASPTTAGFRIYERREMGKTEAQLKAEDDDKDGVPSAREAEFGFHPARKQTWLAVGETARIGSDEEWLCFESMRAHVPGSLDKVDWSSPGKQWP